ncbi:MAG: hypothetical protein ACI87E_005124 [Mariniblastus sp.]|jgi:hypothetical protein
MIRRGGLIDACNRHPSTIRLAAGSSFDADLNWLGPPGIVRLSILRFRCSNLTGRLIL